MGESEREQDDLRKILERISQISNGADTRRALEVLLEQLPVEEVTLNEIISDATTSNTALGRAIRAKYEENSRAKNKSYEDTGEPYLGFSDVYFERESEFRRSVFLDPIENAASHLSDFYTGKISHLEFRVSGTPLNHYLEEGRRLISGLVPKIRINKMFFDDNEHVVASLRNLADYIEKRNSEDGGVFSRSFDFRSGCELLEQTETLIDSKFIENGKKYVEVYKIVEVLECPDGSCGNCKTIEEDEYIEEIVVWTDGTKNDPPPAIPEPFERYKWENKCKILDDSANFDVTSDWGWRRLGPANNPYRDFHGGIDVGATAGTPVYAAHNGEVVSIVTGRPEGQNGVKIKVGNTIYNYWHIDPNPILPTGPVAAGTLLGLVSPDTVTSTGAPAIHLHFAKHNPPGGDHNAISDKNSSDPCP